MHIIVCIMKLLPSFSGVYTGVEFNLPPEISSGVGSARDCIDQMQDLELCEMERKFRDMGFNLEEAESSIRYDCNKSYLWNS